MNADHDAAPGGLYRRWATLGWGRIGRTWPFVLFISAIYGLAASTIYVSSGLGTWSPTWQPGWQTLRLSLLYVLFPAVSEELIWRWGLISPTAFGDRERAARAILLSSTVALLVHPLVALTVAPQTREMFLAPVFLVIVLLLGLTCGTLYVIARSIWPSVVVHWVTIVAWKFLFGGPFLFFGR